MYPVKRRQAAEGFETLPPAIFLCAIVVNFKNEKRQLPFAAFFLGEGIFCFLWGVTKNYIMYWGGYEYYSSTAHEKSVHKYRKIFTKFLCIL